tara:strand:+ start:791 stop:2242 length:1452 start_codon:yes stop_codon:yes gene_type:complete
MATFSRELLRSLTQPAFQQNLFAAAEQLGGMPAQREELEKQKLIRDRQNSLFKTYQQGLRSFEDANVAGVTGASKKLSGMLSTETNDTLRSDLMTAISNLGGLQEKTQVKKDNRNVSDLIQAENLLKDLEQKGDARTENENFIMNAVQQRVDQLNQMPSVAINASEVRRDARIAELTKKEALAVAETNAMKRELSQFIGTPQFNEKAQEFIDRGVDETEVRRLVNTVLQVKKENEQLLTDLEALEPLSPKELKIITDAGFTSRGSSRLGIKADRELLNEISKTEQNKRLALAFRELDPVSAAGAKSIVIDTLNNLVEEGELEPFPIIQDLSDKVEKILNNPDEIQLFLGRVEGSTKDEVENIVLNYIEEKFPKEYQEMQKELKRRATVDATKQSALVDIARATNAARGQAAFEAGEIDENRPLTPDDEGYFDLENEDDLDRAIRQNEQDESKRIKEEVSKIRVPGREPAIEAFGMNLSRNSSK